jgi:hypothetical protein
MVGKLRIHIAERGADRVVHLACAAALKFGLFPSAPSVKSVVKNPRFPCLYFCLLLSAFRFLHFCFLLSQWLCNGVAIFAPIFGASGQVMGYFSQ